MSVYTVQIPPDSLGEPEVEKAVFLREGFSWPAFFFGFLFLLWHELWVAAAVWIVVCGAFIWLVIWHFGFWTSLLIALALQILLGLEANGLRRHKLEAKRYQLADVVSADALEDAERQFFNRHAAPQSEADAGPKDMPAHIPVPSRDSEVLGLFPQPEERG